MRLSIVAVAAALASSVAATSAPTRALGDLVNISCAGAQCNLSARVAGDVSAPIVPLRLVFFAPHIVRWWLALDGNFSDVGAAADVVVGGAQPVDVSVRDAGAYFEVTQASRPTPDVVARVAKSPVLLTLLVDGQAVVQELAPLSFNGTTSSQTLARDAAPFPAGLAAEYFFGGGMQHGRFSHRDKSIAIARDYNWDNDGHPNSAPWYLSTAGYGVFRNTWAPGAYAFASPVVTAHNETHRFDAFFLLAGPGPASLKTLLGLYTQLTGAPFLVPLYGLYMGDSDCYHNDRHGNSTKVAIAVARLYRDHDMPTGWMLPNDGEGWMGRSGGLVGGACNPAFHQNVHAPAFCRLL